MSRSNKSHTAPEARESALLEALTVARKKEERTIADKIADSDRPSWEQFKKENKNMLDPLAVDGKEMEKYRRELDADRERRMGSSGGGGRRHRDRTTTKQSKKKKHNKKKKRKRPSSSESSSESSNAAEEQDEDEDTTSSDERRRQKHKKRKHKKHKKRHRKEEDQSSLSSVEYDRGSETREEKQSTETLTTTKLHNG